MCFHSVALRRGNATEWESANSNHSNFHRALASPEHFSAECAAIVIISRLRADKLIQKEGQTVWRAICQFYWNTFIVYIITYFSTCFGTTLLNVLFFFKFRDKTRAAGENPHKFFFQIKSSTFFSHYSYRFPFQIFHPVSQVHSQSFSTKFLTVLSKLNSLFGPYSLNLCRTSVCQ